jgi:hypothetical protein
MLIRDKDGDILRAAIAPAFMTVVTSFGENDPGRVAEFPTATLETWEWEIVEASDEERALMREHGILPEQHTLWIEDEKGERHEAHLEFAACLNWDRLRCTTAQDHDEAGSDFAGCRVVAASAADVKLLRRFGLNLEGLDAIEERLDLKQAA